MQSPRVERQNRKSVDRIGLRGRIPIAHKEVFIHIKLTHTNRLPFEDAIKRSRKQQSTLGQPHTDTISIPPTYHLFIVQNSHIKIQVVTDLKYSLVLTTIPPLAL